MKCCYFCRRRKKKVNELALNVQPRYTLRMGVGHFFSCHFVILRKDEIVPSPQYPFFLSFILRFRRERAIFGVKIPLGHLSFYGDEERRKWSAEIGWESREKGASLPLK